MKKQNGYFFLLLVCLGIGIALVAWAIVDSGKKVDKHRISVIVNDSGNSRWVPFQEGLKRAAKDSSVYLNFVSTEKMTGLEQENQLITQEIKNGADAVIVQFCQSSGTRERVTEFSRQTVLELVETDVERDTVSVENCACAAADGTAIGRALAEQIAADFNGTMGNRKIGVVAANPSMKSVSDRTNGLEEAVRTWDGTISWEMMAESLTEQQVEMKQKNDHADILVAMDDESLQILDDYAAATGAAVSLYGVGSSDRNVYNLDRGVISAMVVPYEFSMGYQAVVRVAGKLKKPMSGMKNDTIDFAVITKENMFDEKNQELLFPIVQ